MMPCSWSLIGPLQWIRYVNKEVKVKAGKDEEHRGVLFTVDPVSASLVLVDFRGGGASVKLVMGHAVQEVQVLQEADPDTTERLQTSFMAQQPGTLDPKVQTSTRKRVQRWLKKNLVPVEEEGPDLRVARILTISPPYGPEDCQSSNQIILDRIQRLIQNCPDQLESDPETDPKPTRELIQ